MGRTGARKELGERLGRMIQGRMDREQALAEKNEPIEKPVSQDTALQSDATPLILLPDGLPPMDTRRLARAQRQRHRQIHPHLSRPPPRSRLPSTHGKPSTP